MALLRQSDGVAGNNPARLAMTKVGRRGCHVSVTETVAINTLYEHLGVRSIPDVLAADKDHLAVERHREQR